MDPVVAGILYPGISQEVGVSKISGPYLINVGSIDARKNQILLVDILHELERLEMGLPLYLVGPIDPMERLNILARKNSLGVHNEIHFTGNVTSSEARELISGATLYIHTALRESFGRTLVEAMATQVPVVALDYPAVHEILQPAAIMSRNWQAHQMAQFIAALLLSPQALTTLQQEQQDRFNQNFTEPVMYTTYLRSIGSQGEYHAA